MIKSSVKIDWTQRESVQAEIRVKVKKILASLVRSKRAEYIAATTCCSDCNCGIRGSYYPNTAVFLTWRCRVYSNYHQFNSV